jgi:hypothetical protein
MAADRRALQGEITGAIERLDQLEGDVQDETVEGPTLDPDTFAHLSRGLRASLQLAEGGLGECRQDIPFSPMRPVLREGSDKVEWCCNHNPPHCG